VQDAPEGRSMGYDFRPKKKDAGDFYLGAFSWPVLVEQFGCMFPFMQKIKWYCVFGIDERMPATDTYPRIISNDGFKVRNDEAKMMAQMARNYVAIQRSLPEQPEIPFNTPDELKPWPRKIRTDFVDQFEKFADWAEKSGGFSIR
jgi:hypothetical protein